MTALTSMMDSWQLDITVEHIECTLDTTDRELKRQTFLVGDAFETMDVALRAVDYAPKAEAVSLIGTVEKVITAATSLFAKASR